MPDENGKLKGISVSKVWPGHPDFDPDEDLRRDEAAWEAFLDATEREPKKRRKHHREA